MLCHAGCAPTAAEAALDFKPTRRAVAARSRNSSTRTRRSLLLAASLSTQRSSASTTVTCRQSSSACARRLNKATGDHQADLSAQRDSGAQGVRNLVCQCDGQRGWVGESVFVGRMHALILGKVRAKRPGA